MASRKSVVWAAKLLPRSENSLVEKLVPRSATLFFRQIALDGKRGHTPQPRYQPYCLTAQTFQNHLFYFHFGSKPS